MKRGPICAIQCAPAKAVTGNSWRWQAGGRANFADPTRLRSATAGRAKSRMKPKRRSKTLAKPPADPTKSRQDEKSQNNEDGLRLAHPATAAIPFHLLGGVGWNPSTGCRRGPWARQPSIRRDSLPPPRPALPLSFSSSGVFRTESAFIRPNQGKHHFPQC